jgi:hypothetical protein
VSPVSSQYQPRPANALPRPLQEVMEYPARLAVGLRATFHEQVEYDTPVVFTQVIHQGVELIAGVVRNGLGSQVLLEGLVLKAPVIQFLLHQQQSTRVGVLQTAPKGLHVQSRQSLS